MRRETAHEALRLGLIGEHEERYRQDPAFAAQIRFLAEALPSVIDALAQGEDRLAYCHDPHVFFRPGQADLRSYSDLLPVLFFDTNPHL